MKGSFRASLLQLGLIMLLIAMASMPTLAQDTVTEPDSIVKLVPLANIQAIAAGRVHACALTTSGGVKCWGDDEYGQIGDGAPTENKVTPVDVVGLTSSVKQIAVGDRHNCALTTAGGVKCWGRDFEGQVGNGLQTSTVDAPVDVTGLSSGVKAIAAGGFHTCALSINGEVWCWGLDSEGQIGDGADASNKLVPKAITSLGSGVRAIAGGSYHTCAITASGGAKCWGQDDRGQVGELIDASDKLTPVDVHAMSSNVQSIAAGFMHTCAISTAGALRCWGSDQYGQVGDNANGNVDEPAPVNVFGLSGSGVQAVDLGDYHTCALTTSGVVKCWGLDSSGQAGDGVDDANKIVPVDVIGLGGGVQAMGAGGYFACALSTAGMVKCWGSDSLGQIGDGPTGGVKTIPVDVMVNATCYKLTRSASAGGSVPSVSLPYSSGCPLDHFLPGTNINLTAHPGANQRVQSWGAPAVGGEGDEMAALSMPAADTTVFVTYAACRLLTRTHTGGGGDPLPSPGSSPGCQANRFAAGERIALDALPNANQRVKTWTGAAVAGAGSQINTLTMPNADANVSVTYEACFALTANVSGQGAALVVSPDLTHGCLMGGFAAGETVNLTAAPAAGWRVAGWIGTADDASTAITSFVVMPGSARSVGVTYEQDVVRYHLPMVWR